MFLRIATLLSVVGLVSTASAQVFEDDFERPNGPADGWTAFSGSWQIVDGTLVTQAAGGESWAWAGDPNVVVAGDMIAELSVGFGPMPTDGVGRHGGVMFYASVPRIRWDVEMNGYTLDWIDRAADHGFRLIRWDNGSAVTLVNGTPAIADPPATWRIEVEGDSIQFFGDDVPILEFTDGTYREGRFGAWGYQNGTRLILDNVVLDFTPIVVDACFTVDPTAGGAPLDVDFDASCSTAVMEVASYDWDFGDGTTGEGMTISHQYEFSDLYAVTLTVTDVGGNAATTERAVQVFESAEEFLDDFSRDDGPIDGWTVWRGDWSILDETLTTTTGGQEHWVWAGAPPVWLPEVVEISFDLAFLVRPGDAVGRHGGVAFCATAPTDRYNASMSGYELDWIDRAEDHGLRLIRVDRGAHTLIGRGAIDPIEFPDPPASWRIVVGPQQIQVYGDDVLVLESSDTTHRGGLFGLWVWVNGQQPAYDNVQVLPPEILACFTLSPEPPLRSGSEITFDGTCSQAAGGAVAASTWDFGDGSAGMSGGVVNHTFAAPGTYDVTLTVENAGGDTDSFTSTLEVFEVATSFADDFERTDGPPADWTITSGGWSILDGALQVSTLAINPEAWIWTGSPPFLYEDVTRVSFRLNFLSRPFGEVGRHGGAFLFAQNTRPRGAGNSGYSVDWIDRAADRGYRISVWNDGVETSLLAGNGDMDPGAEWAVEFEGDTIRVLADGTVRAEVTDGTYRSGLIGFWVYQGNESVAIDDVEIGEPEIDDRPQFQRGDVDVSSTRELTDGVFVFNFLFLGGPDPRCMEAADVDNDGVLNLTDGIRILNFLFLGGPQPNDPFECGVDTDPVGSAGDLGCAEYPGCPA